MKALFFTFFFAIAVVALGMVVMVSIGTAERSVYVPPSQKGNLTIEQENALLAEVEFSLGGSPSGDVAVFVDENMLIRLDVNRKVRVPLTGNDRCGVNLKVQNAKGDWEHATSVGCIDHTPYASIGFAVEGTSVKVSEGAWRQSD